MSFALFWILTLAIKLAISASFPLSGDEAYYWVWAQKLQLSYFDHPPFVAWLFALIPTSLKIFARWPGVILGHLIFFVWYKIFKLQNLPKFDDWKIVAILSPLLGIGAIIVTPDLPLLVFWSFAVWIFLLALENQRFYLYCLLGFVLGLGFLSKYAIVLLVPVFIIYLFAAKKWNFVSLKYLIATVLLGALTCLPVLIWNYQHDWISFNFQMKHGLDQGSWELNWTTDYIFGTIFLFFPTLFWGFCRGLKTPANLFHKVAALVPLLFFLLSTFKGASELNWPLVSYPHMLLLCVTADFKKWQRTWAIGSWITLYLVVILSLLFPEIGTLHGKLLEPFKYKNHAELPQKFSPLLTSTYQMASCLWYFSDTPVYKVKGVSRFDYFDMLDENVTPKHFYYMKEDYQEWPEALPDTEWEHHEVDKPLAGHTIFEVTRR